MRAGCVQSGHGARTNTFMAFYQPFQITQAISNAPRMSGPTVATSVHSRPCKVSGTSHSDDFLSTESCAEGFFRASVKTALPGDFALRNSGHGGEPWRSATS